ncbi:hypothetical protein EI94DRAFT_1758958 [Lactarius quietus]|nr:hypothetical protein EI94DRAFT_1758958 [Lactarius quietus]
MVQCGNCDEWYHFRCVNLNEDDASEISESFIFHFTFTAVTFCVTVVYVCPSCQEKTGWCTVSKCQTRFVMHGIHFLYPAFLLSRIVVLLRIVTHAQPSVFVAIRDYLHELHIIVCLNDTLWYQVSVVVVRQDSSCIIAHVM